MADVTPTTKDFKIARNLCPTGDFVPSLHADSKTQDLVLGGGCSQCIKTAKAIAEVRKAGLDGDPSRSLLVQAIGLMSTAKLDMQVDIDDPIDMAQQVVAQARAHAKALRVMGMRLRTIDPEWKNYGPKTEAPEEKFSALVDAIAVAGIQA